MMRQSIFVVCVLLLEVMALEPQVYENADDQMQVESNTRVVREPFAQPKSKFYEYQKSAQQDHRRFRYARQQLIDMQTILRKKPEAPARMSLAENGKVVEPTVSSSTIIEHDYQLPAQKNSTSIKVSQSSTTKKPVTSRKLKPSSYYEDLDRQDTNQKLIYVTPNRREYDLNALNALVGQNPTNQLQGLKQLLGTPHSNIVLPLIKAPPIHPISENTPDIPNPNTHPNVDTSSIQALQAQLDKAAQAQLAKTLADAQRQAMAHVEAQHQAIAEAQAEARKKVLAQIAFHNQAAKQEPLPQPLALALKQEVVPANLYAPGHGHEDQNEDLAKAQSKANLKSPNAYQEVVLETQQKRQSLYPGENQLEAADNHQYAARYAFGYKVRDVKMGNEFGHEEKRDGENARGLYHVLLPDGRMQKVEYYVDNEGYHAKVSYENLAHH